MNKLENEKLLITELSKPINADLNLIKESFYNGIDYVYLLGHLLFNRVGGIAYCNIEKANISSMVNREFRTPLKMVYESSKVRSESFSECEKMLCDIFINSTFSYAFLKGALLNKMYEPGMRTSNDFDVLVSQSDLQKVTDLLINEGFIQGFLRNDVFTPAKRSDIVYARMNKGEIVPFVKEVNLPCMKWLEIDINFSLDFKGINTNNAPEDFVSRAEPLIEIDDKSLFTLNSIDFLMHLCSHLYKEATTWYWVERTRDLSLYKFSDIFLFIKKFFTKTYVENLIERIKKYELESECFYTFYHTRKLFNIKDRDLDYVIESITPQDKSVLKRVFDPKKKTSYLFEVDFTDYFFSSDRTKLLKEE